MNLCKIRYCYLKAVDSSDYCYKHVKEECLIKEPLTPKCSFVSIMKMRCDESVNNIGDLCDKHANQRKILAELERDFVNTLDFIGKNRFENTVVVQQDDVEHGFEQTKEDIAKMRKQYIDSNDTSFSKLATESFLKVYAEDCDEKLKNLMETENFNEIINEARKNKVAEDTVLRVIADYTQIRLRQKEYYRKYIEKGKEILNYNHLIAEAQAENEMNITDPEHLNMFDVVETVQFMVSVVSGDIPVYHPRIPADYKIMMDFNKTPCSNINCMMCPKLAVFQNLCLEHSRNPIFDKDDTYGYYSAITDNSGEPNNVELSKTSGLLFIHGRSSDKEVILKSTSRNTYSNWSTRAQHGLIANLPSTSDLFIRTAKNARYPLVNTPYHSTFPTLPQASASRAPRVPPPPATQPQYSRTLALGHPPTRMRIDNHGQLAKALSSATGASSSTSPMVSPNSSLSHQQPTYTVISRYPSQFDTTTIVQTNEPSSTFRPRQRLPPAAGYRNVLAPSFRIVRNPTIRIMTAVHTPRILSPQHIRQPPPQPPPFQ